MVDRITTLDDGYVTGDLSIFPEALDTKDQLHDVRNNAEIPLKQTLSFNGKVIIVDDTSMFPNKGIIRVGLKDASAVQGIENQTTWELIYYDKKTSNTFQDLIRGFSGSRQGVWPAQQSIVAMSVSAEVHNSVKDAILNIEGDLGVEENPEPETLNAILKEQETRFLAPKPLFRAFPTKGAPALTVRFQNFSTGDTVRNLWDFGDGATSLEKSPNHTYIQEGQYTVKLNIITSTGAQGVVTKLNYITVDEDESIPFFYVDDISDPYSVETAASLTAGTFPPDFVATLTDPKEFTFVDQTDGDIVQRNWVFGDGETFTQNDPDIHDVSHIYQSPGEYTVTQLIIFSNGRLKRIVLGDPLVVL
jgi:PKD repeat protein